MTDTIETLRTAITDLSARLAAMARPVPRFKKGDKFRDPRDAPWTFEITGDEPEWSSNEWMQRGTAVKGGVRHQEMWYESTLANPAIWLPLPAAPERTCETCERKAIGYCLGGTACNLWTPKPAAQPTPPVVEWRKNGIWHDLFISGIDVHVRTYPGTSPDLRDRIAWLLTHEATMWELVALAQKWAGIAPVPQG